MDEFDRLNAIPPILSSQSSLNIESNGLFHDFAKCFSIDNANDDDDDIIFLDENDLINDDVKIVLNSVLKKITDEILIHQSQIENLSNNRQRSYHTSHSDEYSVDSKKVRFTITSNESSLTNIFISEQFQSSSSTTTNQIQFLSNLGFDLCLEQNLDMYSNLSPELKQNLTNFNQIFHQYQIYSCKYCSFQANTIHVMDNHYQTLHMDERGKYFCTKCSFRTYCLPVLRRHFQRKHQLNLLTNELMNRRYQCCFCSFETNHKTNLLKHNRHCQIEQQRTMNANNLLEFNSEEQIQINKETNNQSIETLIIESDHDISSDEAFLVSSDDDDDDDDDISNSIEHENTSHPTIPIVKQAASFSSLSKLLFLNNTSINSTKSTLVPIQPRSINGNEIYQICHICQLYISKSDFAKHIADKHKKPTLSTPIVIVNNPVTYIQPTLIIAPPVQNLTPIYLLSTSTLNKQLITLNMIKCPWCDTNFEHIDIVTGHLMKYHRMTLAAAKVVVAEQMKIQGSSSNQLSVQFQQEIELIEKEFSEKSYWHLSQPKVYLHQIESLSCFVCQLHVDNLENHLLSSHQVDLLTLNQIKQCCLCGQTNHSSLFEHQLRSHQGVCYSTVLKQFIRFQPPPPPPTLLVSSVPKKPLPKSLNLLMNFRRLTTSTNKKFACRKCSSSDDLLTFDNLVEHLRSFHKIHVKLHRRCIFCQQTFVKGKEYNQHCLQHVNDEYPSIKLRRQHVKSRK